jgi:hypothetical protein
MINLSDLFSTEEVYIIIGFVVIALLIAFIWFLFNVDKLFNILNWIGIGDLI